MSFGKNSSRSRQSQWSQDSLDPEIRGLQVGNVRAAQAFAGQPAAVYSGQRVAGFSAPQVEAQQGMLAAARAGLGGGTLSSAVAAAGRAANYMPGAVTGAGYQAVAAQPASAVSYRPAGVTSADIERVSGVTAGPAAQAEAASIDRGAVRNVATGGATQEQIAAYLNPYTREVVNTSLADIERQRAIQESLANAQARRSRAFGGTGAAVAASLSNENYERQKAMTAAQLYSQGFDTALGAAQSDLTRRLQADQGNQQADLAAQSANAGYLNQTRLENMGALNRRSEFNAGQQQAAQFANQGAYNQNSQFNAAAMNQAAQASAQGYLSADQMNAQMYQQRALADAAAQNQALQFNAGQAFGAEQANQNAGLAAAQLGLSGAGMLGQLAGQERGFAYEDLERMLGVGAQHQALGQAQMDADYEGWLQALEDAYRRRELANQAFGILGNPTLTRSEGTSTSRSSGFDIGLPG